jgi:hypothetical protein
MSPPSTATNAAVQYMGLSRRTNDATSNNALVALLATAAHLNGSIL